MDEQGSLFQEFVALIFAATTCFPGLRGQFSQGHIERLPAKVSDSSFEAVKARCRATWKKHLGIPE